MGNIKDVIEFLRLQRRYEEAEKKFQEPTDVQLSYLEEDGSYSADKIIFETDFIKFKRIVQILEDNHAEIIYLYETPTERKYFVKTPDGKLCNLLDQSLETLSTSGMAEFPIEFKYNAYIYDTEKNRIVILSETLKEVVVFPDTIYYSPDGEFLKDVDNNNYQYQFSDHTTFFAKVIKFLFVDAKKVVYDSDKKVNFRKAELPGKMRLIPFMDTDLAHKTFILKYAYDYKDYRPKLRLPDEECAIILKFNSVGALLSFLNETLFSQGFDIETSDNQSRDPFREQFKSQIIRKVEENVKTDVKLYYRDMMEILYYLPESVAVAISNDVLWMLVEEGMKRDSLTNKLKLAEEDIYIKLLEIILQKEGQETVFIERLSQKILDGKKYASVLEYLYDRIHGDNVVKFVNLVNRAWKKTRFIVPDLEKNPEYKSTDGPIVLPYQSEKWFGFYFSNAAASFETNKQKERILQIAHDTGKYKTEMRPGLKTDNLVATRIEIVDYFWYHPFYPIYIKNLDKQETELELDSIIPAFMLKANHDKQFWNNVVTGAEYALDVVTTLSGIGNIAKFRYLAKFAAKAGRLRFVSQAGRTVATVRKVVAATAAVVEITSGSVNILLKLSNLNNSKFGKSLQEYLFWLELLSLSGELSVAIHNGLKKSAKEILEHEDELIKEASKGNHNIDNLLDEIYQIAEEKVRHLNIGDDLADIAEVDIKSVAKIADRIRKTTKLKNFDILVVDRNNEALFDLFKAWQKEPRVEGVFIPRNGVYRRYGISLKGPRIYLFTGNTSDGFMKIKAHTLQHEVFHVEMHAKLIEQLGLEKYQSLIDRIPTHIKEEYVVHRFLATDSKALDPKELNIELDNINNKYRKNANIDQPLDKDYLAKEWNLKNELKKLNIHY